jgi:hypothetical protein
MCNEWDDWRPDPIQATIMLKESKDVNHNQHLLALKPHIQQWLEHIQG